MAGTSASLILLGAMTRPARLNACYADVAISEIRIDQPSTDNDEYFELAGAAGSHWTD